MNPKRVIAGFRAKVKGDDFEAWCARHHDEALRLGILAHWVHNEPHGKKIHGRWEMVGAGVADVTGVLQNKTGTTLAAEMKSREERLYRHGEHGISVKQQEHLDAVAIGGGLAFLLVRITDGGSKQEFAVPWRSVPWRVLKSAESVGAEDLQPWRIPAGTRCYLESYCPVRGEPVVKAASGRVFPRE